MNEPQVWTLISVFSLAIFGMLGVVSLFARLLRAEIGKVGVQIHTLRGEINARFDGLSAKFAAIDRGVNK